MRILKVFLTIAPLCLLHACATSHARPTDLNAAAEQVRATELGFARTMADRDFEAFRRFLSNDAVFFDDDHVNRGPTEVAAAWKPLFNGPKAPFSWAPDRVEVLASGDLALSTGLVMANGKAIGRFNSIWRLESPHTWRIVFDKGEPVCKPSEAK